jgi:hypothetical protein
MSTLDDLTEQEQRLIAADFAEHVLPLFEAAWAAARDTAGAAAMDAASWDAERAWQQQRIDEVVAARGEA